MAAASSIPNSGGAGLTGSGSGTNRAGSPGQVNKPPKPPNKPPPKPTGPPRPTQPPHPSGVAPKPAKAAAAPSPLAPLSNQQITKQATNTITKAYAPSYTNLNQQQTAAQAIQDKRESDNKYYQDWLAGQQQLLQGHADDVNRQLTQQNQALLGAQNQLYSGQAGTLIGDANARAGNVTNNSQSNSFGNELAQYQSANEQSLGNSVQMANNIMATNNSALTASGANAQGILQAGRDKQLAAFQTAMTNIANQRSKLQLTQGADIAKEITRLQGVEVSKAQSNRNFIALEQKLGLTRADAILAANTKISTNAATNATNAANNANTVAGAAARNAATNATSRADAKLAAQTKLTVAGMTHAAKAGKGATPTEYRVIQHVVNSATGLINQIMSHGISPQSAYQFIRTGHTIFDSNGKVVMRINPMQGGLTTELLNAAYSLRQGSAGLTPGDVAALQAMGISPSGAGFTVAPAGAQTVVTPGAAASPH